MHFLLETQILMILSLMAGEMRAWRTDRRPRLFGSKLKLRSLEPGKYRIQKRLVQYHNFFRSKVKPEAANMLALHWSKEAAEDAQRWADACQLLIHDSTHGREVEAYGPCGQNIFVATHQVPWFFAVKTWWLEKDNFTYGGKNDLFVIGHYTQMVWHSTHEVGCGLAYCPGAVRPFYNYVCNYCPMGDILEAITRSFYVGFEKTSCPKGPANCKNKKSKISSRCFGAECLEKDISLSNCQGHTKVDPGKNISRRHPYYKATGPCRAHMT
ncbi:unnamed protein product, partial [Meganyctiphanes norvegica]